MKKKSVIRALALMCTAFFVLFVSACPNAAKKEEPKPAPEPVPESWGRVPINLRMKSIETAMVDENNTRGDYVKVKDFEEKKSGPYAAGEEGKTAYIYFRVEAGEKPEGKDFILTLENINAYNAKTPLKRGSGADSEYFEGRSVLSKGINRFVITVKSGDETESGEYRIAVDYKGGPDEAFIKQTKKPIPGIYCPAQRKAGKYQNTVNGTKVDDEKAEAGLKKIVTVPEDDGKEEFVWAIHVAGYCGYCNWPMEAAGKGKIAEKYKDKGLRVIVVSGDKDSENQMLAKWKTAGAEGKYLMYKIDNIIFNKLLVKSFPGDSCIRAGKTVASNKGAIPQNKYDAYIKEAFGF